ncbi:GyrI-like domain-containing protein [Alicyclobacillus sp. SO9]|nr:GyrI-like domain-containing protein [Alicyclobacillus sp. SO9]
MAIQQAWSKILPIIRERGYQPDNRAMFERYTGDMTQNEYCEICIPVKPI